MARRLASQWNHVSSARFLARNCRKENFRGKTKYPGPSTTNHDTSIWTLTCRPWKYFCRKIKELRWKTGCLEIGNFAQNFWTKSAINTNQNTKKHTSAVSCVTGAKTVCSATRESLRDPTTKFFRRASCPTHWSRQSQSIKSQRRFLPVKAPQYWWASKVLVK